MTSPAEAVAMNEWVRGERGQHGDIHLSGLKHTEEAAVQGMYAFQRGEDLRAEGQTQVSALERVDELCERNGHDAVIVVVWGGVEAELALEEFAARRTDTSRDEAMPVVSAMRIEHDQVWENSWITHGPEVSQWHHLGALPDVSEQMIPRGYKSPARSSAARLESLTPVEEPLGSLDPRAAESIALIPPSARVDSGVECLDALTYAAAEGIEDPGIRAGEIQVLSQCVASDPVVRDSVAVYAADHRARTASLIDAYRHAPVENREAMSACAAAANALGGGSSEATEILALPASESREHSGMVGMLSYSASRGLNPAPIKARLEESLPARVQEADTSFIRDRDQQAAAQAAALNTSTPAPSPVHGPGL